jgi:hypothetical protein
MANEEDYEEPVELGIVYKFRAETNRDAFLFLGMLGDIHHRDVTWHNPGPGDCIVSFRFEGSGTVEELDEFIHIARTIVDCHVLAETIELIENYTGDRKFMRGLTPDGTIRGGPHAKVTTQIERL